MNILVIPDTQVREGVPIDHMEWIGNYAYDKRPDLILHLGDHWDMPSLSSYDQGKRSAEGRRFKTDIIAGNRALTILTHKADRKRKTKSEKVILRGNHEYRIERAANDQAFLEGIVSYDLFNDKELGWKPVQFLHPRTVAGVTFCHYFPIPGNSKRGPSSARAMVSREMVSCIAGHKQGLDSYIHPTSSKMIRGIIAGSCYLHDEEYLTGCMTNYWRGVLLLHEVDNGSFGVTEVSLDHLRRRYG